MDVYCTSCFGCVKFSGFLFSKTSANKRLFIYMSANGCIATVCRSGIYAARPRFLTTRDVSNRKSTTNVWIVQMIMKNYYIDNAISSMSSMRQMVARAAHKAVLFATISRNAWQKMYYLPYIYRVCGVVGRDCLMAAPDDVFFPSCGGLFNFYTYCGILYLFRRKKSTNFATSI